MWWTAVLSLLNNASAKNNANDAAKRAAGQQVLADQQNNIVNARQRREQAQANYSPYAGGSVDLNSMIGGVFSKKRQGSNSPNWMGAYNG
jgi:hypothetical protein